MIKDSDHFFSEKRKGQQFEFLGIKQSKWKSVSQKDINKDWVLVLIDLGRLRVKQIKS